MMMTKGMFGPKSISTPNFYGDFETLILNGIKRIDFDFKEVLDNNSELKDKMCFICERFEFINMLEHLEYYFKERKTIKEMKPKRIDSTSINIECIENISFDDCDFTGIDYDIEALVIYLLFTCIDTINGKESFIKYEDWIVKHIDLFCSDEMPKEEIIKLIKKSKNEYYEDYGVRRKFKKAFISDISEELRSKIISNFALLKIVKGHIDPDSTQKWEMYTDKQKIKQLAEHFFSIRNGYTHSSTRTFIPNTPIKYCANTKEVVLIQLNKSEVDLVEILIEIIQNLVYNLLKKDVELSGPT